MIFKMFNCWPSFVFNVSATATCTFEYYEHLLFIIQNEYYCCEGHWCGLKLCVLYISCICKIWKICFKSYKPPKQIVSFSCLWFRVLNGGCLVWIMSTLYSLFQEQRERERERERTQNSEHSIAEDEDFRPKAYSYNLSLKNKWNGT